MVGFGLADGADIRGDGANLLLVDALDGDLDVGLVHLELDALGSIDDHGMGVADGDVELVLVPLSHAPANAFDGQGLLKSLGDTNNHVIDEGAIQTMHRAVGLAVGRAGHDDFGADLFDFDILIDLLTQLTLGALDAHDVVLRDGHGHAGGNLNRKLTDSTHSSAPPTLLPDIGQDFAADALLTGRLVGHHALGRGHDGDAQAAQDLRDLIGLGIDAQTRLGNAL